uniref:ABC transporter domain-containing protein n=1 Tax=Clastoptera arizonana TaxID=38151 RepID=A0A1B6C8R7_9HEMI
MDVEFQDLEFTVNKNFLPMCLKKDSRRVILKCVSGRFKAGELSAILGPSGAGKSSLLNAISGYRSKGITGKLLVNGQPRDESKFRKMSCYITQEDLLQPMLTLNELMMFAADLKLSSVEKKQKKAVVNDIQSMLGLVECKHTTTECLSGGQKKRLSIALELINNPPVLFLDEPTSGLDNVTTATTIRLLRTLAHQGRTVVCTIHQPSASLFGLFDNVYVLAAGLCVYQGATGELVPFLSSVGLLCPTYYNPADFVIEATDGEDEKNISLLSTATGNGKLTRFKKESESTNALHRQISGKFEGAYLSHCHSDHTEDKEGLCADIFTSNWTQFFTLLRRMLLQIRRNTLGLKIQFYHHFVCGLAIGIVFFDKGKDGAQFFNHMKFCMGIILFHTYTHVMVPVLTFPYEVKLLRKEHFNRWYNLNPYYLAYSFSRVPVLVFNSLLFLTLVYFMSGLPREMYRFFLFSIVGITTSFVAEGMGLAIGCV